MFIKKKTNLEYLSKGISNIRFIIHPKNSDIFPIEILFKLIHSNQLMPFIKYNPGNKRENIYRLYTGENIATNGKKIPILSEKKLYKDPPDFVVLFSWHIASELKSNLKKKGNKGKFIIPLPHPKIEN